MDGIDGFIIFLLQVFSATAERALHHLEVQGMQFL